MRGPLTGGPRRRGGEHRSRAATLFKKLGVLTCGRRVGRAATRRSPQTVAVLSSAKLHAELQTQGRHCLSPLDMTFLLVADPASTRSAWPLWARATSVHGFNRPHPTFPSLDSRALETLTSLPRVAYRQYANIRIRAGLIRSAE